MKLLQRGAALLLLFTGCQFDQTVRTQVSCSREQPACPPGFECNTALERCVSRDEERVPPEFTSLSLEPRKGRLGTRFTLTFRVNEPLLEPPKPTLQFEVGAVRTLELQQRDADGLGFRYEYEAKAADPNGAAQLALEVVDVGGNVAFVKSPPSVELDLEGPKAFLQSLQLQPLAPGGLQPTRMGPRTNARVTVTFSEPVRPDSLVLEVTPAAVVESRLTTSAETLAEFELRTIADAGTTALSLVVRATDLIGTTSTTTMELRSPLLSDADPPVVQPASRFDRFPNGSASQPGQRFHVTGTTEPQLFVRTKDVATGLELGRGLANDAGVFDVPVAPPDRDDVSFEVTDEADNRVEARPSRTTLVLVPTGRNGASAEGVRAGRQLVRNDGSDLAQAAAFADGVVARLEGTASWREFVGWPNPNFHAGITFDEGRGVMLAFGDTPDTNFDRRYRTTREFDGTRWRITTDMPTARVSPSVAYDSARARTVIFGGSAETDTLEFDGRVFRRFAPLGSTPPPRLAGAMGSSERGVLLLGGITPAARPNAQTPRVRDAWQREGSTWFQLDAGAMPLDFVVAAKWPGTTKTLIVAQALDAGVAETWTFDDDHGFVRVADAGSVVLSTREFSAGFSGVLFFDDDGVGWLVPSGGGGPTPLLRFTNGRWLTSGVRAERVTAQNTGAYFPGTNTFVSQEYTRTVFISLLDGGLSELDEKEPYEVSHHFGLAPDASVLSTGGYSNGQNAGYTAELSVWTSASNWSDTAVVPAAVNVAGGTLLSYSDGGLLSLFGYATDGEHRGPESELTRRFAGNQWTVVNNRAATDAGPRWSDALYTATMVNDVPCVLGQSPIWCLPSNTWVAQPGLLSAPRINSVVLQTPSRWVVTGGESLDGGALPVTDIISYARGGSFLTSQALSTTPLTRALLTRIRPAVTYDPTRSGNWLYGGSTERDNETTTSDTLFVRHLGDGGLEAERVDIVDPDDDGNPDPTVDSFMWFDGAKEKVHLINGRSPQDDLQGREWVLERARLRPAVIVRFALTNLPLDQPLGIGCQVVGQGVSGDGVAGLRLSVWTHGRWQEVARSANASVSWSSTESLRKYVAPGQVLALLVEPTGDNRGGTAVVEVDSVELSLSQAR